MSIVKTITDLDYIIYLDNEKKVIGFELTPDELSALSVKYNSNVEKEDTIMPKGTEYILEVFGINSVILWLVDTSKDAGGKLIYYKPTYRDLATEILKEIHNVTPCSADMSGDMDRVKGCKFLNADKTCFISLKTDVESTQPCPSNCNGFEHKDFHETIISKVEKLQNEIRSLTIPTA